MAKDTANKTRLTYSTTIANTMTAGRFDRTKKSLAELIATVILADHPKLLTPSTSTVVEKEADDE
ncbi:MAG: hypothetical protein ACYDBB_17715 [Armatimonadota bacterium]